ncbi:MAG TPA: inorganic phosphate transporter [Feifaniaceae bacterium]|nr:inorganic phosphate transporter [Feifaniaceae bacterium]
MPISFWILVALTFIFTYVNGFHDGCNVVATLIASRSMRPYPALAWAAVVEVLSPFAILILGSSVSDTIKKLVAVSYYTDPNTKNIALAFITAGILAAIIWNLVTWLYAIPASSSHALIGGVVGAGLAAFSSQAISWSYFWTKVVLMIFVTPVVSFIVGFCILVLLRFITRNASLRAHTFFTYAQWFNMSFLAFNHSFNDSQKTIGIVMILIGIYGGSTSVIPLWAIACAALCLAFGIAFGGFKIIKTVGTGIYKVQAIDSFASQMTAGTVILVSSLLGAPVSSSQIVSSSIMGVGAAERYKAVKWHVAGRILLSWFITIPIAGSLGALLFILFSHIF